jgi:hypothetical protein
MEFLFGMEVGFALSFELLFALIYVECKRDPEKQSMLWFVVVKSIIFFFILRCIPSICSFIL